LLKHYNENQPLLSSRPSCHRVRRTWFVVPRKSPVRGAVSLKLPPIIGNATYRIFFGFVGHAHAALSFTLGGSVPTVETEVRQVNGLLPDLTWGQMVLPIVF
jgi:hypothetical protein